MDLAGAIGVERLYFGVVGNVVVVWLACSVGVRQQQWFVNAHRQVRCVLSGHDGSKMLVPSRWRRGIAVGGGNGGLNDDEKHGTDHTKTKKTSRVSTDASARSKTTCI